MFADAVYHLVAVYPSATKGLITQSTRVGWSPTSFSRMKHGGHREAAEFGNGIATMLGERYESEVLSTRAPVVIVPESRSTNSAARLQNQQVVIAINRQRRRAGLPGDARLAVARAENNAGPVGDMSHAGRLAVLNQLQFRFEGPNPKGTVFLGDDLIVTGGTMKVCEMFLRRQFPDNRVRTFSGVQLHSTYVNMHPEVEGEINRTAVSSVKELATIASMPGWRLTTWAARLLESAAQKGHEIPTIEEIVTTMSQSDRAQLLSAHPTIGHAVDVAVATAEVPRSVRGVGA